MVPPPMSGQHPLETILQKLLHRANLLRPGVPAVVMKGGECVSILIPGEMIASEKEAILVEQAHMAPGVTRHRNESQVLIKVNWFISADDLLHTTQTSTSIGAVHDA